MVDVLGGVRCVQPGGILHRYIPLLDSALLVSQSKLLFLTFSHEPEIRMAYQV